MHNPWHNTPNEETFLRVTEALQRDIWNHGLPVDAISIGETPRTLIGFFTSGDRVYLATGTVLDFRGIDEGAIQRPFSFASEREAFSRLGTSSRSPSAISQKMVSESDAPFLNRIGHSNRKEA